MKQVGTGIIIYNGKILIGQRPVGKSLAGLWEFPGGKIEDGETIEQCLTRELWEELGVKCRIGDFIMQSEYNYTHGDFILNVFFVHIDNPDDIVMNIHQNLRWVTAIELSDYDYPPADLPIVKKLQSMELPKI